MQIKKKDEWKITFTTLKEVFKPIVIFFELTNSLVIFQMIMNEILQDLINIRKVEGFIDNVIIKIEKKKGHNEIVEKVVKRLVENDLYMKLEKCKWKIQEVEFLEVVIGLKKIKIK